jgi:hypothetical protein
MVAKIRRVVVTALVVAGLVAIIIVTYDAYRLILGVG